MLEMFLSCRVSVLSSGEAMWAPAMKWETSCKVDLFYFPFDEQFCEVQFINWMYGASLVNLTSIQTEVDTRFYTTNGLWKLVSTKIGRWENIYSNAHYTVPLPMLGFRLHLARLPGYFILNIIVPAVILTFMSLLVFCLPAEAGDKVSIGMTVLLSYSLVILMVTDITPRVSDSLPIISKLLSLSLLNCILYKEPPIQFSQFVRLH